MTIKVMNDLPVAVISIFFNKFCNTGAGMKSVIIKNNNTPRDQFSPNPFQDIFC